jgi:tRNA (pseudouridine54-N1)-methyltransferase|tara:strand:- start:19 stop:600 length:582 start_codon:yes stop_codon:yes gene_type:complete
MSKGKLPLNDLTGAGGRMDVLVRALMAGLLTSHGLRRNTVVVLHLMGGPGPPRRIKFDGSELKGLHADERSIAGTIGKVIATPLPPIGHWQPITAGITHSGGDLRLTLREWNDAPTVVLDADAPRLWSESAVLPSSSAPNEAPMNFILSDDQPLGDLEGVDVLQRSLGTQWLQGHMAVAIVHFLLDEGVAINR